MTASILRRGVARLFAFALLWLAIGAAPARAQDDGTAATGTDDATTAPPSEYTRELLTVEEDVKRLKERVFRSKATLQLLKEIVIEGATVGSRVVLWHVNKMGPAYTMESVQYFLDGKNVFTRVDPGGSLDDLREVKVHEQTVPPGTHSLEVHMVLRGNGFGVFSYLRTYTFKVQSSYTFTVQEGEVSTVRVIANEKSGLTRSFVDRPSVQYEETLETVHRE